MARERTHKKKPRRRRGRFIGLYKLLSILLVAAVLLAACLVFFRVNRVTAAGYSRYTAEEVVAASGIQTGDNLIALPKGKIANRIIVDLPYVRSVSIDRVFPDGVLLTVEEHMAAGAVSSGSAWWYISSGGKLLEQNAGSGPIRITGVTAIKPAAGEKLTVEEGQEARLDYALKLLALLEARGYLSDCSELDCSEPGVLNLHYLNFTVRMPTTGDFSYMLSSLQKALDQGDRVNRNDSGTFDFTVEEGKIFFRRDTGE